MGSNSVKKSEAPAHSPAAASKSEPTRRLYIGPTLPRLGLIRNTVYSDIPKRALEQFEAVPQLQALFLRQMAPYPRAAADLEQGRAGTDTGGFYYQAYQTVAKAFGGEKL